MPEAHPTYRALIDAGLRLAEQASLSEISIDQIVRAAGVAKGTFYVHFPDRSTYLVALHTWFHNRLKELVVNAVADMAPGIERLYRATIAYLDGCLEGRAVKALLLEARAERAIEAEVQRRNAEFAELAATNFRAMGWLQPEMAARLYVAMTAEAAVIEVGSGLPDQNLRAALFQFIQRNP
jgi:TetR/AcrR family transcriptional regulator, transcriptional repressor for nem operon